MPDMSLEDSLRSAGAVLVAGIDEAGRGPLAGPVVAAAVVIRDIALVSRVDDSKKMSDKARRDVYGHIRLGADVGVGIVQPEEIDRINILQATFLAMVTAVSTLSKRPCHVLVDGNRLPKALTCPGTAVVKGDGISASIAAASIVAKTVRDDIMVELCGRFPGYEFSRHMGYGTKAHLEAIERLGASPVHRMTFAPLKRDLLS